MAVRPVKISNFTGLDNKSAPESLITYPSRGSVGGSFSPVISNIDITKDFRATRRTGYVQVLAGVCHSLWYGDSLGFIVKDNYLGTLDSRLTFGSLTEVPEKLLSYAEYGGEVFLTNGNTMWAYSSAGLEELTSQGTYSPDPLSLEDVNAEEVFSSPPPGDILIAMFGRLWVANKYGIFYSRGFQPRLFDYSQDFINFPNASLLAPVADGFYFGGDDGVWFFPSKNPKDPAPARLVSKNKAIPRTQLLTDAAYFGLDGATGDAVVWESAQGKVIGLSGGRIAEVTRKHTAYPVGDYGTTMLVERNGETFCNTVVASKDADASNTRTTDVATAEIVRNGIVIQ